METVHVVPLEEGNELSPQVQTFVQDLNWLRDEGYIEFVEDPDGTIRLIPTAAGMAANL